MPRPSTPQPRPRQAILTDVTLSPETGIREIIGTFDEAGADELAVVAPSGKVLGVLTEKHARRRYLEEIEADQKRMFGETEPSVPSASASPPWSQQPRGSGADADHDFGSRRGGMGEMSGMGDSGLSGTGNLVSGTPSKGRMNPSRK
jgi:CBS domain-containing protein